MHIKWHINFDIILFTCSDGIFKSCGEQCKCFLLLQLGVKTFLFKYYQDITKPCWHFVKCIFTCLLLCINLLRLIVFWVHVPLTWKKLPWWMLCCHFLSKCLLIQNNLILETFPIVPFILKCNILSNSVIYHFGHRIKNPWFQSSQPWWTAN